MSECKEGSNNPHLNEIAVWFERLLHCPLLKGVVSHS